MGLRSCARLATVVLALGAAPVAAQEQSVQFDAAEQSAPLGADESALLGRALQYDPATLGDASGKSLKVPTLKRDKTFDISRASAEPDGSGTVVVRQTLSPEWGAKVGADLNLSGSNPVSYQPQAPLDAYSRRTGGGAAWASIDVTDAATIDARVDPNNDQGRLAGTVKHSMPVGSALSVTVQNSLSVTDTYGTQGPSAPAGLPMMALPQDSGSGRSQVFGNEQAVKFNVVPTGTTLAAALASTSDDPVTHNTFSASQKLLGPLSVTTSVSDVGQATVNKSISAGFKLNW
ncbi:hypothetical protein [Pseudolabrys taiwanensis]|uniref:hypothetical protein n=1 Tax=Pseudolabrys taiwanensis TaxID=331696 RepID=UPI0013B36997|nr:hypothetical protein [Pseudolabrys taiwanensis]